MAIPILRAAIIPHSQPLLRSFICGGIDETSKKRKTVLFPCSTSSSELNPAIRSEISFSVGSCLLPLPDKVDRVGKDVLLVSNYNAGVLAIADGVSGWAEEDVDPLLFPRELLANASNFVEDMEVNCDPQILIRKAHAATCNNLTIQQVTLQNTNAVWENYTCKTFPSDEDYDDDEDYR